MTRGRLAAVRLVGLLLIIALSGCGNESPRPVALKDLAAYPTAYQGQLLALTGTARNFADPPHAWIEDADLNRVEILPAEKILPYLGETITVVGQFSYSRNTGRRLQVERVEHSD